MSFDLSGRHSVFAPFEYAEIAVYRRRLEVADAEALLEVLMRDRAFLDPWNWSLPDSFFTLDAQRHGLARLREAEDLVDFGIFEEDGDELVGRIQLSGISPPPFANAHLGYFVSERHTTCAATRRLLCGKRSTPPWATSRCTVCKPP